MKREKHLKFTVIIYSFIYLNAWPLAILGNNQNRLNSNTRKSVKEKIFKS